MKYYWGLYCLVSVLIFCTRVYCQCLYNEECIVVKNCPSILKLLIKNPLPAQDVQRLRNSQCGYDQSLSQPKVCCPKSIESLAESNLLPDEKDCGTELHIDAIYRGHSTTLREFPWLVLLQYQAQTTNKTEFRCAGALINQRHVLTSANCILRLPLKWKLINVRLGEHRLDTDPDCEELNDFRECADSFVDVPIESITVHPQFNVNHTSQANDIAIIRLNRSVLYTEWIQPICLPKNLEFESQNVNTFMTVAGFGTVDRRTQSNIKNKLDVSITSDEICTAFLKKFKFAITDTQICVTGRKYENSCISDNGGPLMKVRSTNQGNKWYLYGIMSFGELQCNFEFLGTYATVTKHMSWIVSNLKP